MTDNRTDSQGVEHAPRCERPGVTVKASTLAGWNLARCAGCKGQRLTRRSADPEPAT